MMFTNDEASKDALVDSSLEDMLQDTAIEEEDVDEFDDNNDIDLLSDLNDADLSKDVEIPTEVCEYITTLESQTQQLEKELEKCDELLMYLPHQPTGNRQAVVLYEDSMELDKAAAEHGLSVEEFKQKILSDLEQEDFTEEDVKRDFEEFSQLQEELNELRSAIRQGMSDEIKAILPYEDATEKGGDNSLPSEETILALCNGEVGMDAHFSQTIVGSITPSFTNEYFEAGPLVSSTALSGMRDYVLEQLRTVEQQHEVKVQTLAKSIEKCKQEEETILLHQEERRKMLLQVHDKEEAAMLERLKENERLGEEEQKVKNVQTTQELNLIQIEIDQLSEALEKEKHLYEVSRGQWLEQLDTARKQAALQIQKVYRGHRARRKNASQIEQLKEWKKLNKEEKYKRRIMEVDYEIKYLEEKAQREKERQEKEAAEEKMKKEEEERHKENEQKKKQEENRIFEELRKEKERKNKEQRLEEERQRKEEEKLKKETELKHKEEERLRKEEEKNKKNDERKKKKEEEDRKKEEKRKIKEEEKKRTIEEKQIKVEEMKAKEKNIFKEEETIKREQEKQTKKEIAKKNMKKEINIKDENIREEKKEVKETGKRSEEEMRGNNEVVTDKERERDDLKENIKNKCVIVQLADEKVTKDIGKETNKMDLSELTKTEPATRQFDPPAAYKGGNLLSNDGTRESQLLSSSSVSMTTALSASISSVMSHDKGRINTKTDSALVQPLAASVSSSASFQETSGAHLRLPSSESQVIHQQRLNWIKSCIPWSKISCEPWKLKQTAQKSYKRPAQAKKLPPVSEAVILDKAHASSLREVTSVTLISLPECSLSTLGQCWSLRYLTVTKCGLMCLEGLDQCKHLLYINAEHNNIEYMDLKDLGSLQVVRLAHNSLSLIHGFDGCINLRSLDLSHNRITRISGLGSLRRVHTLNLSHNQLVNSDGLEDAITVQNLDLSHNYMQRLANISKLCLLTDLILACNNLRQVPELQNQVLLQTLCLQENSIRSLEPLSQYWLPLLHTLNCSQNMLESVTGTSSLVLLSYLDISHNQITDMENLLPGLTQNARLETLVLEGNPVVDAYTQEYQQLVTRAVPSLKSLDTLSVQPQAAESGVGSRANLCDDVIQMCLAQANLHTALKDDFNNQMKVLLVNQHVTAETLCSTCFTFCDTSFKMASEHRSAHEYGDTSTTNDINHSSVFIVNGKAKFHAITGSKPQLESMADKKHTFNVSESYNTPDKSVSDTDSIHNAYGKMVKSVAILDKENYVSDNQSAIIKNSNSVTVQSDISSAATDQYSNETHVTVQPDCDVSKITNSTTRHDQSKIPSIKSRLSADEANKTTRQSAEVEFNLSETNNSDRNNSYSNIYNPSATGSPVERINRFALAGKQNLENSMQDNNSTVKTKAANVKLYDSGQFGQYLSGKDKFEIALQARSSTTKILADGETHTGASTLQSMNGGRNILLSGVKANVVGGQLLRQDTSGIRSRDLELSALDSDGNADLDSMDFDIDSFLDMEELDELLELGWRPADVPHIPQSSHPVLGKIKATDNSYVKLNQQKVRDQNHILPHPPDQPSQAWTNSPVPADFKSSGLNLTLGAPSPVTAPSPLSVTSTAETGSRGSIRSKKEELSEEWGFKDSRTIEMMLARAKKMKYNSERRRKLDKLDPQQKLHLLKKLEEKYRIKSTRPPTAKILPRKEYFKAREEEFQRQELEKQTEDSTRASRMFEWLHTQVGDHHAASSRLNPGVNSGYFNQDNASSRSNVLGYTHARKSSPLSDHHKSVVRDAQQVRRYSSEETLPGHSTILPPIHESSLPSSHKKDRISYRDTPVEISGGWGGGKKRGKINRQR